ncbi:MAG: hypothetical protein EPO07_16175 [Verrucomicrobia bacterium]|nr:MAG: hypothetical protein EPO07_16175 [Verrucomicrobiota bacterium]
MKALFQFLKRVLKAETFSPEAFVGRAAVIALLYAVSCIAGLEEYTAFLSGTSANLNLSWQTAALLGLIHLLLYFAFILLVPISLITAGLLVGWNRWRHKFTIPAQQSVVRMESKGSPGT